jgi:site-specific recombinase XerD
VEGEAVPVEVVVIHIAHLREKGAKLSTVRARVAMLSKWHKTQGLTSPTAHENVKNAVSGYEKHVAEKAKTEGRVDLLEEQSTELLRVGLLRILATIDTSTVQGLRDRALFLLGWCGGFRVSELVTLRTEHLTRYEEGIVATCHATKTGKTIEKEINREEDLALCPVRALETWLDAVEKQTGEKPSLIFRSVDKAGRVGEELSRFGARSIVKKYAKEAGLPEGVWSCHSLRSGYATQASMDGVPEEEIRRQGGWAPTSAVFFRYVRKGRIFSVRRARVAG